MNFSRLYMQSWWEVPSIAYFCSLFRTAFNLLDFDIEELEEALVTDGTEDSSSSLLTELIVRLLNGCLGNNDISAFNYQMYLRRLFRRKCQETGRINPFNTDIDFQFLPLRTKVEILYALCDFRLDAEDVLDLFKNLEAESLRVEPLGWDDNDSAYWYFYGTRLYREDIIVKKPKGKTKKRKSKESRRRGWFYGDEALDNQETERVWQVVCFTEDDWTHLTEKFSKATSKVEKELHRSLSQNFLPEIPRLFQEKEKLQRKRLLELPRRTSNRVLQKIKQKEEETKLNSQDVKEDEEQKEETSDLARENRAKRRNLLRSKSVSSISSKSAKEEMPQKLSKRSRSQDKKSKNSSATHKGEPPPETPVKAGRKTNNSLASATGQILIPDSEEPINSTRKKLKTSQIFSQSDEDVQTDMYKVLEQLTAHDDAWPFMDPVEEEYAPNYYAVIRRPMNLRKMEKRLDSGYYTDFSMFKADFKLIVNNCRLYNGQDNEYTKMVDNLQAAFDRLTEKYIHRVSSSDEEIAVEFQVPTPSRKHKLKSSESHSHHKKKKRKSHSDTGEGEKSNTADVISNIKEDVSVKEIKKSRESHKNKEGKIKKKHKRHHRHGKHSKNHKKNSHKSSRNDSSRSKHNKQQKHGKNKDKNSKKSKKKKSKHRDVESTEVIKRCVSQESIESSNRSRSASPLPSIHTPSPSPTELDQIEHHEQSENLEQISNPEFIKDKYDKIKERRRNAAKDAWDSLFDYKHKNIDKEKHNLNYPDKNKNLTETIEKLKAKNEKFKDSSLFNNLFNPTNNTLDKNADSNTKETLKQEDCNEKEDNENNKQKRGQKKTTAKNESASQALEQAVKDISKWLDDDPKGSTVCIPCDSPAQTISTEDHENSRLDDELSQGEKSIQSRKETSRKRRSSREPKLVKRREIQRTIDRLQPGKSKGNLLTNITHKVEKQEEVLPDGLLNKVRDSSRAEESSPKLTLGSVLPTVQFTIGSDHNFNNEDTKSDDRKTEIKEPVQKESNDEGVSVETKIESVLVQTNKKDAEVETEPTVMTKPSQEKATPNLSAWFKAFGTPKNTPSTVPTKRKLEDADVEEKVTEITATDIKLTSPRNVTKSDSTLGPENLNQEGGESPLLNATTTPRQRRTSTGSSISERSSFSQDLDSPRHQISHTSPLIQSPASPRTEDFQKITYPIINGTVRAGFYQDTNSIKSSPEKSCSPREAPQSPFSPYAQHVYASNSATGSTTPNYFIDHNKSPLPTYTQNPPPYYDTSKLPAANKAQRGQDDYTALGPDSYQRNHYPGTFSPGYTPVAQISTSNYSHVQESSQSHATVNSSLPVGNAPATTDQKSSLFPVKKRIYNDPDQPSTVSMQQPNCKELPGVQQNKTDYQNMQQPLHTISALTPNSDNVLALNEKCELPKLNNTRDKITSDYVERTINESKEHTKFENNETIQDMTKDTSNINRVNSVQKDNIDMVNMGYMIADDRKINGEMHNNIVSLRDIQKHNVHQKGYDIEAIAINLGLNNQSFSKAATKPNTSSNNIPPAHMQDRLQTDVGVNPIMAHAHHNHYETLSSGQTISNFSINDIEQANKKLYACNSAPSSDAIDFGNWKMSNQMRKQEVASDYSTSYNICHAEKPKSDSNTTSNPTSNNNNYSKSIHQQQYSAYMPRYSGPKTEDLQQNLSELRIPNPRELLRARDRANLAAIAAKTVENLSKSKKQKTENESLTISSLYNTPYSTYPPFPLDSLQSLSKFPQILDRYTNEERYAVSFSKNSSTIYHERDVQMAHMLNKSMPANINTPTTSYGLIYTQSHISNNRSGLNKSPTPAVQSDIKNKTKRKRAESKPSINISQSYHNPSCRSDVLSSVNTNMMQASGFNFSTSPNMALGSGLYGDNTSFSVEANQLMAANYMAAAVAHQQRSNADATVEKIAKPAHQNSNHATGSFPFIGHSQVPGGYSFVGTDTASPLYQQYLQRHQEELIRQTGAQIIGLYPSGYPASLGARQPYDSINRPSWL